MLNSRSGIGLMRKRKFEARNPGYILANEGSGILTFFRWLVWLVQVTYCKISFTSFCFCLL